MKPNPKAEQLKTIPSPPSHRIHKTLFKKLDKSLQNPTRSFNKAQNLQAPKTPILEAWPTLDIRKGTKPCSKYVETKKG